VHHLYGARRTTGVALLLSLCACSGGGGDNNQSSREIQLSPQSISFSAVGPDAPAPETQVVTATLGEGAANVSITFSGRGVDTVTSTVTGNTAQIAIKPSIPSSLGAGIFTTTVAATGYFCADSACSRLDAGGSQTMKVTYQVSPVVQQVGPKVAIAGIPDQAVIRGVGFRAFTIGSVKFGDVAATDVTVFSDTEIHANYPALAAGSYPIVLDIASHQGAVPSLASVLAVDPTTFAAQALAWPDTVTNVYQVIYDIQHTAVLVATDGNGGEILRYAYANGAWSAPTVLALPNVRDMALTNDGAQLLAISTTQLIPIDPVALTAATAVSAPTLAAGATLKNIVVSNVNRATITAAQGPTPTPLYDYNPATGVVTKLTGSLINATPGMSANGAIVVLTQGDPSITTAPPVYYADASTGTITATPLTLSQNSVYPALDRNVSRLVLAGQNVYNSALALQGLLPATTLAVALSPDGTRAYTYDSAAAAVLVFDISASNNGAAYPQLGSAVALPGSPGSGVRMVLSLDAKTLFIAGTTQLIVLPTP
jgi:hypothetical protein